MPAIPIIIGFIIDAFLGDPYSLPHPVRLIGTLISRLEGVIRKRIKNKRTGGTVLALTVLILSQRYLWQYFCCAIK